MSVAAKRLRSSSGASETRALRCLEPTPVDPQFADLELERLPRAPQLAVRSAWTRGLARGFPSRGLDHLSFALDEICSQRNSRCRRPWSPTREPTLIHRERIAVVQ